MGAKSSPDLVVVVLVVVVEFAEYNSAWMMVYPV